MAGQSSYLRFLPPVLWEKDPPPPAFSLGSMLRIFEKILTGIPDSVPVVHGEHEHPPIEAQIAAIKKLFDPWQVPASHLPYLASWVALEFSDLWDDYQRRKITSEITQIYQSRGLKAGLARYLDLYTVAETRPRVAIDDSSKLLYCTPDRRPSSMIHTLTAQMPLIRPLSIARAPDGALFVTDIGGPGATGEHVWRIFPPGHPQFDGPPAHPRPIGPPGLNLEFPMAVAVRGPLPNYEVYFLDRRTLIAPNVLFRSNAPALTNADPLATNLDLFGAGSSHAIAMTVDLNGHLLILDRGAPIGAPSATRVVDVDPTTAPVTVVRTAVPEVLEPMSIAVLENGDLLIGDGRERDQSVPGDLVRVDRAVPGAWIASRLFPLLGFPDNPLVSPTGIAVEDATHVFVVDVGLKPLFPTVFDPYLKKVAEGSAIYRVDLAALTIDRESEPHQLVFPTGVVSDGRSLYLTDRGEYSDPIFAGPLERHWRMEEQEFGVAIHFSEQRPTTVQQRRRIAHDVYQIIERQKPAHAHWTFAYSF